MFKPPLLLGCREPGVEQKLVLSMNCRMAEAEVEIVRKNADEFNILRATEGGREGEGVSDT